MFNKKAQKEESKEVHEPKKTAAQWRSEPARSAGHKNAKHVFVSWGRMDGFKRKNGTDKQKEDDMPSKRTKTNRVLC